MLYLLIGLAISVLVIIHEFGHYLVARAFGMRVVTYSIGFGPVLWKWRPKGSETLFQVALIPMLAYVQIAGMAPRETPEPNDRGSYQNASTLARFFTIAAGPLANYLAASVLLLAVLLVGGQTARTQLPMVGEVSPNTPAAAAGVRPGDLFVRINDQPLREWTDLIHRTQESQGRVMRIDVVRDGAPTTLMVTPRMNTTVTPARYTIGVGLRMQYEPVRIRDALRTALVAPAVAASDDVKGLWRMIRGREKMQVMGPVGIVHEAAREAEHGWRRAFEMFSVISLALFIFNLLPVPALDGGRMVFLAYEMLLRRRPSPAFEARATAISMVVLLSLSVIILVRDIAQIVTHS